MAEHWNQHLPAQFLPHHITPRSLHYPKILERDEAANDFETINWNALLAGGGNLASLDFGKSKDRFLHQTHDPKLSFERSWDIDSIILGISSLAIHRQGFHLALRPPYLRRITQKPRVIIHGLRPHKTKQLR